jgi:hypothetical protein
MINREDFALPVEFLEWISQQGFDILPELIRIVVNPAMHYSFSALIASAITWSMGRL